MKHHLSPFVEVGADELTTVDGAAVTPLYQSDLGRLLLVSSGVAGTLRRGGDVGESHGKAIERKLRTAGVIGVSPDDVRRDYHARLAKRDAAAGVRSVTLLPTSYCNMGCTYCGQAHEKGAVAPAHREAVLRRLERMASDPATNSLSIRWFGGEPLMAFATVKWLSRSLLPAVDEAGIAFSAKIVTNGSLLDERKLRSLVHDCRVTTFNITIDGPSRVHDAHRPLKSGGRSFDKLLAVLVGALEDERYTDCEFQLRTNVDIRNAEHVDEYLEFMAANGFADRANVFFDLHEIHNWGNDVAAMQVGRATYARAETRWLRRMDELGLRHMTLPNRPSDRVCAAVSRDSEVIDAKGNVFSCTEQPLVPSEQSRGVLISLDRLGATARRPSGEFDQWPQEVAAGRHPCSTCTILPVCGGQCPKSWYDGTAACPSIRTNLTERMTLHALNHSEGRLRRLAP